MACATSASRVTPFLTGEHREVQRIDAPKQIADLLKQLGRAHCCTRLTSRPAVHRWVSVLQFVR